MSWQVKCNDGGEHRFGESDQPLESACEDCELTVGEIKKRRLCNMVIASTGVDPYGEMGREILKKKLRNALQRVAAIEILEAKQNT